MSTDTDDTLLAALASLRDVVVDDVSLAEPAMQLAGQRRRRRTIFSVGGAVVTLGAVIAAVSLVGGDPHKSDAIVTTIPVIRHSTDLSVQQASGKLVYGTRRDHLLTVGDRHVDIGDATIGGAPAWCVYNINTDLRGGNECGAVTPLAPNATDQLAGRVAGVSFGAAADAQPKPVGPIVVSGRVGSSIVRVDAVDASTGNHASGVPGGADLGFGWSYVYFRMPTGTGPVTVTGYDASGAQVVQTTTSFWPPDDPRKTPSLTDAITVTVQPGFTMQVGHGPHGTTTSTGSTPATPDICAGMGQTLGSKQPADVVCFPVPTSATDFMPEDPDISESSGHDPTKSTSTIQGLVGSDVTRVTVEAPDGRHASANAIGLGSLCTCRVYAVELPGSAGAVVVRAYDAAGEITATWTVTKNPSLASQLASMAASSEEPAQP